MQVTNTLGGTTTTLFNSSYGSSSDITLSLLSTGGINTLDLLLFSQASTTGDDQVGGNSSRVTFDGTITANAIPVPPTLSLVFVGLVAMVGVRRKGPGTAGAQNAG